METVTATSVAPFGPTDAPPDPPRAVSPVINRRAWTEPSVRPWWLTTLLLLLVLLGFVGDRLYDRYQQSRLISHGVPVTGKIVIFELKTSPGQLVPAGSDAWVEYTDQSGKKMQTIGTIRKESHISEPVPIHYDPTNSGTWTDRTEPPTWGESLFGAVFVLPIVIVVGLLSLWQTSRVRKTWINAPAQVAIVYHRKQTPVAPMSWVVRCSLRDGSDRRLFNVYVPRFFGTLDKGSELWVLTPKRGKPVAVAWFF